MRREMKSRCVRTLALTALMISVYGTLGVVGTAQAGTATARAHGLAATVGGILLTANVAPTPLSSCVSPSLANPIVPELCNDPDNLATVVVAGLLDTGVLNTAAFTLAGPALGPDAVAIAQANVADPVVNVLGLLNLNAVAIRSLAIVGGTCFVGLGHAGSSSLATATTSGLLSLVIPPNATANTIIIDLLGIRVVANEQIVEGNFFSNHKITVNPIHISINNLLGLGLNLLNADITIAQTAAWVNCATVP